MQGCSNANSVDVDIAVEPATECPECVAMGSRWVHLRRCMNCGHVGCCDSSPNRHARAHWKESGHTVISSAQPGEDWLWCYEDEVYLEP
jgi:hypothetical protein